MPRMTAAQRQCRNNTILELFLAGVPQGEIAAHKHVNVSKPRVNQIIKTELEKAKQDFALINENAMTIYLARMEMLIREAFVHVTEGGDIKAIETARKLLEQQAKLWDEDGFIGAAIPAMAAPTVAEADEDEAAPIDELALFRAQREKAIPVS